VIGVETKATTDEIRKAYKKKALKMHPDKGGESEKVNLFSFLSFLFPSKIKVQRTNPCL